jgi:hypothetical protein
MRHVDPIVSLSRTIRRLEVAWLLASDREDLLTALHLGGALIAAGDEFRELAPVSDEGAAVVLREVAEIAMLDTHEYGDPAAAAIARTARRVARAVKRGAYSARDIADLRALLPAAEQMDEVATIGLAAELRKVIAWLARPKVVVS